MSKKSIRKYLTTAFIAACVTICLLYWFGVFSGELTTSEILCSLADAFFVTGVLTLGAFGLLFLSSQGIFDSLSYVGSMAVRSFVPGMRLGGYEKYGDYKIRKDEKRIRIKDFLFILYVGLAFTLLGGIFTMVFSFM